MGSCEMALFNDKSTPNADFVSTSIASRKSITNKETTYIRALPHHYILHGCCQHILYRQSQRIGNKTHCTYALVLCQKVIYSLRSEMDVLGGKRGK